MRKFGPHAHIFLEGQPIVCLLAQRNQGWMLHVPAEIASVYQ